MTVSIEVINNTVSVTSPYSSEFVSAARNLGGRWNGSAWEFDSRDEADVRALCIDIYGTDGNGATTTLRVKFIDAVWTDREAISVAGRVIARAFGRDSGARLGDGVKVECGGFRSGGSHKNWETIAEAGTVVLIRDFPLAKAEELTATDKLGPFDVGFEIVEEGDVDVNALKAEKERLLARIAEIDAALSDK